MWNQLGCENSGGTNFKKKEELCRTTGAHFMNDNNMEIKVVKYGDGARVTIWSQIKTHLWLNWLIDAML